MVRAPDSMGQNGFFSKEWPYLLVGRAVFDFRGRHGL